MKMNPAYATLFEPVKIGPVTAPNRFYAVPHATGHSPLMPNGSIGMREVKAEGGWGVVAMQLAEIDPTSNISNLPMETLWDAQDVASHAHLVERLKKHGALTACEIAHTGLRSRNISTGQPILGPSSMPSLKPHFPGNSKAMSLRDIRAFRQSHREAAQRVKDAGYDIIYVYVAHDASLLWHFLNPDYNFRTDEYGGSFGNRLRLLREVLEDTLEVAKGEQAVAIRFPAHDFKVGSVLTSNNEARAVIEELAELPDLWDVNVSSWPRDSGTSRFDAEAAQEEHTAYVKEITTKPVVGVGRFTSPDAMVSQIKRGVLDLIGGARPSIADPFLPRKIQEGREDEIRECIGCNICVASDAYSVPLRCTQNPTISEEWRRGWHPDRLDKTTTKSVLVIGSGPAGLECAEVLSRAGAEVTLAEKEATFGGRVRRESALPGLSAWLRVADHRLYRLQQRNNATLVANSALNIEEVRAFEADKVVFATGSTWRRDGFGRSHFKSIPGFEDHALTFDDDLADLEAKGPIVIYDDDHFYLGNTLAHMFATKGFEVHLVCPLPSIAEWMGYTLETPRVLEQMIKDGVHMHPNAKATSFEDGKLHLERSDTGQNLPSIVAKHLVAVTTRMPDAQGFEVLVEENPERYALIGDAEAPNTIQQAVFAGHQEARRIIDPQSEAEGLFRRERPYLLI